MKVLALDPISCSPGPTARDRIERTILEGAITAAVKKSARGCEPFVGVIVERVVARNTSDEANWAVKASSLESRIESSATPPSPSSLRG
jgi:hypothetical protein